MGGWGGGVGVGGPPLRDHLWQGPPLPVTLRLIHPPPKMTQGGNDPPNPPSSPSTASLSGVARCWHSNAYFSLFSSLFFFDPPNRSVQIPRMEMSRLVPPNTVAVVPWRGGARIDAVFKLRCSAFRLSDQIRPMRSSTTRMIRMTPMTPMPP